MATHQSALTFILDFFPSPEVVTTWQIDGAAHKLKPRLFYKSAYFWVHSVDFHPSVNHAWQYYQTPKSAVTFWAVLSTKPSVAVLSVIHFTSHFKVQMAFSHCNSSTLVPLLGTLFNMISHFSDQVAYPPNALWYSKWIHQRGCSSPTSSSSTIQPGQTVSSVPGPSIIPTDNDPNWEDTPNTNPITNLTANRPIFSTRSWSKLHQSDNTNKQLAEVLG